MHLKENILSVCCKWLAVFTCFCILGAGTCMADSRHWPDYSFQQISTEQGLSQSTVTCILSDYVGDLWIGTLNGLNKFTLHESVNYFNQKAETGIPEGQIFFITEDREHNLWIGTSHGLMNYDRQRNRFTYSQVHGQTLMAFSCLKTAENLYFGGVGCFYTYNLDSHKFVDGLTERTLPQMAISAMYAWGDDRVLLANGYNGIFVYEIGTGRITALDFLPGENISSIFVDRKGQLWLSPYSKGLYCFNRDGEIIHRLTHENSGLSDNIVLDVIEYKGKIWIGTDGGGISIYDEEDGSIRVLNKEPGNPRSLPEKSIMCLYNDKENNLWAGTVRGGVIRIKESYIQTYTDVSFTSAFGLSEKVVISLFEEKDGRLWIGTDGGGINLFDPHTHTFRHFRQTYSEKIFSITEYSDDYLLLSLFGKGLFLFHKETGETTPFQLMDARTNAEECLNGRSVYLDRCTDDKILILGSRIYLYHLKKKQFQTITCPQNADCTSLRKITCGDSIAYLYGSSHFVRLNCNTGEAHTVYRNIGHINAAVYDGNNGVWFSYNDELHHLDLNTLENRRVETSLFHHVSSLFSDNWGRLWIGAQNMLFCYIPSEGQFYLVDESMGMYPNELLHTNSYKSYSNTIYIGGNNGLVCIDRDIPVYTSTTYPITLSGIRVNGVSQLDNVRKLGDLNFISVPWNTHTIEIKTSIKKADFFQKIMFRYSIEGVTGQYIESYDNIFTIQNVRSLNPGVHTFQVSYNSPNEGWSNPVRLLRIKVTPPFWQTKWFVFGCILVGLLLLCIGVYLYVRKKQQQLNREIEEHAKEVDREKIHFLINISHELRTPLTLIYAPLKRILDRMTDDDPKLRKELTGILKNTQRMKDLVNMVLDLRKMEDGEIHLEIRPYLLNNWVREIGNEFSSEFAENRVRLVFQLDEEIQSVSFDRMKCNIILSNLLSNALKFGHPDTEVCISTTLLKDTGRVRIAVTDAGVGLQGVDLNLLFTRYYQADYKKGGNGIGLAYSKQLVEMHRGIIGAYNNPDGVGATFYFELPYFCSEVLTSIPAHRPAPAPVDPDPADTGVILLKNYSVLVVEDNPEMNQFIRDMLQEHFRTVYKASDGVEALNEIHRVQPDIIVSDVMMPHMNGFELCREVKSDLTISHIPIILLTARTDAESSLLGYKMGAEAYLSKPFEPELLVTLLTNTLRSREQIIRRFQQSTLLPSIQESTISNLDEQFLGKLNSLIEQEIDNPELDVKFLTEHMAMSRASLYNKLKSLTSIGVSDYINRIRIEKAAELLTGTKLSVTEISERTGFAYLRSFSTAFKQAKGVTPTQYRQNGSEKS